MRQALHIFKKDVRHLRWEIGISLVLMAIFVFMQLQRGFLRYANAANFSYLLLCFWGFLCARLIQAEPIPGDRQFWITRPYQWRSLLGAKLLFMVVFIAIPLLVADAVILRVEGFSIASHAVGLLWSLILITAGTLLAFCAFATLTKGLAEWMLGAVVTVGVLYAIAASSNEGMWAGVEWMREYSYVAIVFIAASAVLLWQYTRRGTVAAMVVMAAGWLGSSLFVNYARSSWALELETRFSKPKLDPSPIRIAVRQTAERHKATSLGRQQAVSLAIPVDISGLGEGVDLISDEVGVTITNEAGEIWTGRQRHGWNYLQHLPDGYRLLVQVDRSVFEKASGRPLNIGLTLYLTSLRDVASRIIRPGEVVDVPGAGRCRDFSDNRDSWIVCESALRAPPNVLVVAQSESRDRFLNATSYLPFPADADSALIPLGRYVHSGPRDFAPATLTSLEPLAHFRRDLDLRGVYLGDYQMWRY